VAEVAFAVPGDLQSRTGGYAYARKLLKLLPTYGVRVRLVALPDAFPHPSSADLAETKRSLSGTADDAVLLIDGLAYGAMPTDLIAALGRPVAALVHHPLGLESGLNPDRRSALLACEAAALAMAWRVIVTSPATARLLAADFGVSPERITVAVPGVEPAERARGTGSPVRLIAVGAVSPRKGYEDLIEALSGLRGLDWRLTIAGSLDRDPAASQRLRRMIEAQDLCGRVTLAGAVPDDVLGRLYDEADVFVSASLFEGYGMALAEAMARGLPLVASTGGAAAETVPDGAGLKAPPRDTDALRQALRRLIAGSRLRRDLADSSWAAGRHLPRWSETAATVARVLKGIRP
jgi:glycosyltransferase involved in cell wall biosynthesis